MEGTLFRGRFERGRQRAGRLRLACGGELAGTWNEEGQLEGADCCFVFPDGATRLRGSWRAGRMESGRVEPSDENELFSFEGPFPGRAPLRADPYESRLVAVRPSGISGAGEGLFARRALPERLVCCYYWGRLEEQRAVDRRSGTENKNVVLLDCCDSHALDVPPPFDGTSAYCASLGHKANHASPPAANCLYVDAFHPRFGVCSALQTMRPIAEGEELLLDYELIEEPDWMRGQ